MAFKTGLTVGDLDKIAVLADFNTHGTGVFNLFFDLNKNGKYFEWEDNRYLGTGEDNYALCQSKTVHESESFVIDGATEFHIMKNGGVHSLADIASGNAGIPVDTPVAFWVGVWDSTADDGDVSLTLRDVRVNPSRLLVDDDFRDYKFGDVISCDGYSYVYGFDAFNSIQEAIDAAPEDATVRVKEGTYEEVIKINKSMWLQGEGADSTIIKPSIELNAIVTVSGQGVSAKITGFTVQGPCTVKGPESFLAGILIRDGAYCEIRENIIKDIKEVPNLAGMQRGIGVFVGKESWGTTGKATIEDNVICGYQKGGIVVDNVGSEADIIGNQITGWGETPVIAQNGIQVSRGATAIVQENTVSGHWYTGDNWSSAGILLYEAGDTTVTGNTLNKNQVAIYTNSRASFPAVLNNSFGTADLSNGLDVNVKTDGWPAPDEVWVDPAYAGLEDGTIVGQAIVGYNACPSISEGIAEVAYNGTVYVAAGTYAENLNINKPISLNGAQAGVDARDRDSSEESVITGDTEWLRIRADGVTIDGFTIDSAGWDGHIAPEANNITIKNNIIKRSVYVATGISNLTVTQNWFKDIGTGEQKASAFTSEKGIANLRIESNNFTNIGYSAVILAGSEKYENTVIKDNYICKCGYQAFNLAGDQHGLLVTGNYIENACSEVDWDTQPDRGGIRIYGSAFTGPVNITNNTVVDSYNGFAVRNGENIEGKEINVTHNKFLGNQNAGVYHGGTGTLNAILNYWGAPTGPTVDGEGRDHVNCVPWYIDANMTTQSDQLALTCQIDGNGSVTLKLGDNEYKHDEDVLWNYGDEVQLVATPGSGWRFSKWEGDIGEAKATAREITILMDGNKSVTAVFTKISVIPDPDPGTGGPSGPVEPPVIAPSVTETVEAEVGGTVELEDGSAAVELPANAVPEDVTVTLAPVTEVTQPTTGMVMVAGKVFEITAETEDGELVTQFSEPITLTFKLTQEELEEAEIELEDLRVFYWDEKAGAWIALPTRVDPETGTVTAITDHFTVFAVMAKPDMPALSDIEGHWGEKDILRLVSLGVVGGYEDGTFRPEAGITRQEFAKMVVLAAGLEPDAEPELTFADSDEIAEWARGYVSAAVKAGIITGVGDNRFAPTDPVTRAQAATMIMRSLGEVETALELTFADAETIPEWAKAAILGAVEKGIVNGFEDNTFKPDLSATRVQAAKMLSKLTVVRFED